MIKKIVKEYQVNNILEARLKIIQIQICFLQDQCWDTIPSEPF